jgi:hypothetical protein
MSTHIIYTSLYMYMQLHTCSGRPSHSVDVVVRAGRHVSIHHHTNTRNVKASTYVHTIKGLGNYIWAATRFLSWYSYGISHLLATSVATRILTWPDLNLARDAKRWPCTFWKKLASLSKEVSSAHTHTHTQSTVRWLSPSRLHLRKQWVKCYTGQLHLPQEQRVDLTAPVIKKFELNKDKNWSSRIWWIDWPACVSKEDNGLILSVVEFFNQVNQIAVFHLHTQGV